MLPKDKHIGLVRMRVADEEMTQKLAIHCAPQMNRKALTFLPRSCSRMWSLHRAAWPRDCRAKRSFDVLVERNLNARTQADGHIWLTDRSGAAGDGIREVF